MHPRWRGVGLPICRDRCGTRPDQRFTPGELLRSVSRILGQVTENVAQGEPKMKKALKVGLLVIGALVVVPLLTLRVTGLEPRYVDPASEEFANSGRTAWPGLWLKGEVVHEPVTNWDWVREVNDPVRGNSIMLETRTWYGIPHSVTDRPYPARRQTLHPRNRTRIQTGQGVPLFQGVVDQCHTRSARAHEDRRKDL